MEREKERDTDTRTHGRNSLRAGRCPAYPRRYFLPTSSLKRATSPAEP